MSAMRVPSKGAGALCRVLYLPVFSDQVGLSAVTYGGKQAEYKFKTIREIWKRAQAEGKTLREKFNLFGADLQVRLIYEWQQCEAAPRGTWKSYLVQGSRVLLSRIHEDEVFLKSIPHDVKHLQVNIALLPILIIIGFIPVPNLPLYWSIFRMLSHLRAIRSANILLHAEEVSDQQLVQGSSSPSDLKAPGSPTAQDLLRALSHRHQQSGLKSAVTISYSPSPELDQAVQPNQRATEPMSLPLAKEIGDQFECASVVDTVRRVRLRLGLSVAKNSGGQSIQEPGKEEEKKKKQS